MLYLTLLQLAVLVVGILPEAVIANAALQVPLHDLLQFTGLDDIAASWDATNNVELDTGRLLFKSPSGALFSKQPVFGSPDEWTVEVLFRSGGSEQDVQFSSVNGLSLFLTSDAHSDASNYGGPGTFDGFQFLVNAHDKQGLKIIVNDGSRRVADATSESIGGCDFAYLGSNVPYTLRVSYSKNKNWFKVQLDNNLCFKTDKLTIPLANLRLGLSSSISSASDEFFEVLRVNTFDSLTTDAIDDHGLISSGGVKVQLADSKPDTEVPPSVLRNSLMERANKLREELVGQQQDSERASDSAVMNSLELVQLEEIVKQNRESQKKIDTIETLLLALSQKQTSNQNQNSAPISDQALADVKETVTSHYHELLDSISALNHKLIGEVREQQFTIDELGKKVELLMSNHKEIQHNYKSSLESKKSDEYAPLPSLVRIVLIVIVIGIIGLIATVYRLRHDIKHSKLL